MEEISTSAQLAQYEAASGNSLTFPNNDNHLWLQCWRDQHTDFHQTEINHLLNKFWSSLEPKQNSRVFVPLCGKSLDLIWLAQRGHEVIGVELSPVAVSAFFHENHLLPSIRKAGLFTLWSHDKISILCGDFFLLTKADIGHVDTVYDRAALTALPESVRGLYVEQLSRLLSKTAKILLLTTEDPAEDAAPTQTTGIDEEISKLYLAGFEIDLAYVERTCEVDLDSPEFAPSRAENKVYRLSCK